MDNFLTFFRVSLCPFSLREDQQFLLNQKFEKLPWKELSNNTETIQAFLEIVESSLIRNSPLLFYLIQKAIFQVKWNINPSIGSALHLFFFFQLNY